MSKDAKKSLKLFDTPSKISIHSKKDLILYLSENYSCFSTELTQRVSIYSDGRIDITRIYTGFYSDCWSDSIKRRRIVVKPKTATTLMNKIMEYITPQTNVEDTIYPDDDFYVCLISFQNGEEKRAYGARNKEDIAGSQLSDKIRNLTGLEWLWLFDFKETEEYITQIELKYYNKKDKYKEEIKINDKTNEIEITTGAYRKYKITRKYKIEKEIKKLMQELKIPIYAYENKISKEKAYNPDEKPTYEITTYTNSGIKDTVTGIFDKNELPDYWDSIIIKIKNLLRRYERLEILDLNKKNKPQTGELIFCNVYFEDENQTYCYLTDDVTIRKGDCVAVTVGQKEYEKTATVKSIEFNTPENAPYPIEKLKYILYKLKKTIY